MGSVLEKEDCFGQMTRRHHLAEFRSKNQFLFNILQFGQIHLKLADTFDFGKYICNLKKCFLQFKEMHFAAWTNTFCSNDPQARFGRVSKVKTDSSSNY